MEKINKILLDYIEAKAKAAASAGSDEQLDRWAELWFKLLNSCLEELEKYKVTG